MNSRKDLTYGAHAHSHYDVISAPPEGWESDPFKLTARNGYLYARGVADDKGPVLAIACAAADLLRARKLGVDLLFLVEGEEETGSGGFVDAVLRHKVRGGCLALHMVCSDDGILLPYIGSHRRSGCNTSQVSRSLASLSGGVFCLVGGGNDDDPCCLQQLGLDSA
jgi:hypothetical protein